MDDMFGLSILISVVSAFICMAIFSEKNRSLVGGFFLGFLLGIFGIVVALFWPKNESISSYSTSSSNYTSVQSNATYSSQHKKRKTKICSYCAEEIKQEAIVCRFCGQDVIDNSVEKMDIPLKISETNAQFSLTVHRRFSPNDQSNFHIATDQALKDSTIPVSIIRNANELDLPNEQYKTFECPWCKKAYKLVPQRGSSFFQCVECHENMLISAERISTSIEPTPAEEQGTVRVCSKCKTYNPENAWECVTCGETLSVNTIRNYG